MISSQTSALFLLLHFYRQPGVQTEEGALLGKSGCRWSPAWGDLASARARVGIASDPAGHCEAEADEAILERIWERA